MSSNPALSQEFKIPESVGPTEFPPTMGENDSPGCVYRARMGEGPCPRLEV